MFLDELNPLFQEIVQKPLAFAGGFISGALKLNPEEDPLRNWLAGMGIEMGDHPTKPSGSESGNRPQTIDIE